MYSDGILCCNCLDCIFYYDFGGFGFFCRSFLPAVPLIFSSSSDSLSNSLSSSTFFDPCPRYINFIDHLAELRSRFDGGNI